MRSWIVPLIFALALADTTAFAEEGGAGHYIPGTTATIVDAPPTQPGFYAIPFFYYYDGRISASRQLDIGGEIAAGVDAKAATFIPGGVYTFERKVLGAFYTVGVSVPIVDLEVTGTVSTTLGNVRRVDRATGIGDIVVTPLMMGWKFGETTLGARLPVSLPTGSFKVGRLANPGKNYWTVDPTATVNYNNTANGFNAALSAGVTINSENHATDYHSGALFHTEASVQQLLPVGPGFLGLGANAFWLEQVSDDTGPGARLGPLRGRALGIGPTVTYALPIDERRSVTVEGRWLPELQTRNRLSGDGFWLKGVIKF